MSPCSIVLRRLRAGGWPLQDIAYVLATGYVGLSILLSGVFVRPSQLKISSSALAVLHLLPKVSP